MGVVADTISFDLVLLDRALKDNWPVFKELREEMAAFEPKDLAADPAFRANILNHLRSMNPTESDAELEPLVDWMVRQEANPNWQFATTFERRLMNMQVTTTLLSLSLCEAMINAILAVGMVNSGLADEFAKIERRSVREKWLSGPKRFAPSYSLEKGSPLVITLDFLVKRRNGLVHHKTSVMSNGDKVLGGSELEAFPFLESVTWTERFFALPYDLAAHAFACGEIPAFGLILDRGAIPSIQPFA